MEKFHSQVMSDILWTFDCRKYRREGPTKFDITQTEMQTDPENEIAWYISLYTAAEME